MIDDNRPWLLIEASREGVLRFAHVEPSAKPRIGAVHEVAVAEMPTFTDALQAIERQSGMPLRGRQCAIAMAGATNGETLSMVRARWTITRAGLEAVFGRPVVVINDVGTRAWAINGDLASVDTLRGIGRPRFDRTGRMAMIMVDEGVGAALIDIDRDGQISVLETEAGHMDFAPTSEDEFRLASALKGISSGATWEKLLMLDRHDPAWRTALPSASEPERMRLQSEWLGRFAINVMHGYGAWQGVMLTGGRIPRLTETGQRPAFERPFSSRRTFSRLISIAPVWRVQQSEAVLLGAAERLASGYRASIRAAA